MRNVFVTIAFALVAFVTAYSLMDMFAAVAFAQALPEVPTSPDFQYTINQLIELFQNWKVLTVQAKAAACIMVLIGLVKNSALEGLFRGLGKWKPVVAPTLTLIAALFFVQPFTIATAFAAITTGVAAAYFHQLLDALKTVPGLGAIYVGIIDFIGKYLGRPDTKSVTQQ